MAVPAAHGELSDAQHSAELRKAVIAATVGTTIEWYDFFIYGTAAGLIFPKIFFPNEDPLTGTLAAFGTYFIGFVGRPIGAAIFGHYGDRIGRKATLIATLMVMGIATFLVAFVPGYASIGVWGAIILTVLRMLQGIGVGGEWGGSVLISMEWARGHGCRGLIAAWPQFGVPSGLFLSNLVILGVSTWTGADFATWGWRVPFVLSIVLIGIGLWIRLGILETPVFRQLLETRKIERTPIVEVIRKAAARDHPVRPAAHGRAGAVLHLHRVRVRLWRRHVEDVARSDPVRRAGRLVRVVRHHPARGPHLRSDRPTQHVPDRRGGHRAVRLSLFRHAGERGAVGGVRRDRAVADPARHDVRSAGRTDRRGLHAAAALQRRITRLSACLGHRRRSGAADRDRAVRRISHRLCHRDLHRRLCGGEPGVGES